MVYPRVVLQQALDRNAAAVVLFHNHPSQASEPSELDRCLTDRLQCSLSLVNIRLLDYCVVTDGEVTSFTDAGFDETASPAPGQGCQDQLLGGTFRFGAPMASRNRSISGRQIAASLPRYRRCPSSANRKAPTRTRLTGAPVIV